VPTRREHAAIAVLAFGLASCWQGLGERGCISRTFAVSGPDVATAFRYVDEREGYLDRLRRAAALTRAFAVLAEEALELSENASPQTLAWSEGIQGMVELHDGAAEIDREYHDLTLSIAAELLEIDMAKCPADFEQQWSAFGASLRKLAGVQAEIASTQTALARAAEAHDAPAYRQGTSELEQLMWRLPLAYDQVTHAWERVEASAARAGVER